MATSTTKTSAAEEDTVAIPKQGVTGGKASGAAVTPDSGPAVLPPGERLGKPAQAAQPAWMDREDVLEAASEKISKQRASEYGPARENFQRIAMMWTAREHGVTGLEYTATDVAQMMALVKLSRLAYSGDHEDSWVDLVGYGALGGELSGEARVNGD